MKTKSALIALIVCLFVALFCAGCYEEPTASDESNGSESGNSQVSESVHAHDYTEVDEIASTCIEQGTKSHYKCEECGKLFLKEGEEYKEVTEYELKLPLATHTFDKIEIKTNPTKIVYTAFERFDADGMKVVKHCAVDGCDGEEVANEDVTFAYERDGADKFTADMTKVVVKVEEFTTELAVTVNKISVKVPVAASKEYNGDVQIAEIAASEFYTVTENNGGTAIGEYDVTITLTDSVNYAFEGIEGATATVKFEITKTSNEITMPGTIAGIKCGGTPVIGATAKENAEISYVYAIAEDGEYAESIEGGFVAGTYYVKAVAAETANYKETVSAAMGFVVEHALGGWNTDCDESDTGVCVCGEELSEYVFDKVVTVARQDVILSDSAIAVKLDGVSEYASVKSIACCEISLGNDVSALTVTDELTAATHGEQTLTVIVTDFYGFDHTVEVPVTLVTESISTLARLKEIVSVREQNLGKRHEGKYFILANDIRVDSYFFNPKASNPSEALTWDNAGNGFAGTLDGRNHSFIGGSMYGGGMFCSIESGTIKNVTFDKVNVVGTNRTLIAGTLYNATIENVRINIVDKKTVSGGAYFGILSSHPAKNLTLKNVTIDATGSSLPWIIGHHSTNGDSANYHCENVRIIAASVDCFSSGNNGKLAFDDVTGVSYAFNGSVEATDEIDPKEFGNSFEYSYTFEEPWSRYTTLKSVKLGDTVLSEDTAELLDNMLVFYDLTDYVGEAMFNKTVTFTVEFDAGAGNSVVVALNVKVLDANVRDELTTRQDIILKDASGDKTTFTLDLGKYNDCTVTAVEFGEETLTLGENGTITVPESMKNGTHGENSLYVKATKGNGNYGITVPVTIVTESISTFSELVDCVTYKTGYAAEYQKGKYFILASDISVSSYNTGSAQTWQSGFAGTLDGRNKSLVGGSMYGGGLFGVLNGATIKNIVFKDVQAGGQGGNRVLFAQHITSATISNVKIYITSKTDMLNQQWSNSVIARGHVQNLTISDVLIDATGSKLPFVLGQGGVTSNIKATNVTIKADVLECILKDKTGTITSLDGVTFESTATAEV